MHAELAHLTWDYPEPFAIEIAVTEAEIDGLGHANNAVYLQWCERVAWAHSEAVGLDFAAWQRLNAAMAIYDARLKYAMAARLGDRLACANWIVTSDRRLRATRHFQFQRIADGKTLFRADLEYVCINMETGKPRRVPPEFLDAYPVLPSVAAAFAEWCK